MSTFSFGPAFPTGLSPFAFASATRTRRLPTVAALEAVGFVKLRRLAWLPGVWVMRREPAD